MIQYQLSHVSDGALLSGLKALTARERETPAELLAHLAEVDDRKLYLPAAYPSMFAYCVGELHLSEDAAYKRILVARIARQFPALFPALAEGRLHMTAVVLLSPHLTRENAEDLIAASAHHSKAQIENLLAERFPRPDLPTRIQPLSQPLSVGQLAPERVEPVAGEPQLAPERVGPPTPRAKLSPLSPGSVFLQVTIGRGTHEKLQYIQALLGYQLPSGDAALVLDRAFDALIRELEKRKFASTSQP